MIILIVIGVILAWSLVSWCESTTESDVHSRIRDKEIDREHTAYLLDLLRQSKAEGYLDMIFRQENFNELSRRAKVEAERELLFPQEWIARRRLIYSCADTRQWWLFEMQLSMM